MKAKKLFWLVPGLMIFCITCGCVNQERNYKPAGFNSTDEVKPYLRYSTYFASKLTPEEWNQFYKRFPEYWQDIQYAKNSLGGTMEFHPWYVAYATRWVTLNKKIQQWDEFTVKRLQSKTVESGDDIFKIVYALGPPKRLIWNNDFEILIYHSSAIRIDDGKLVEIKECSGCSELPRQHSASDARKNSGMTDENILEQLKYKRPKY